MLIEDKNIDQLFQQKLGEYEKTPPMLVWTNIRKGLNERQRVRRILWMKTVGIAAALVLAFLAGWQLTNPTEKNIALQNSIPPLGIEINKEILSTQNTQQQIDIKSVDKIQIAANPSDLPVKTKRTATSNLSSLAAFAPSTSILNNEAHFSTQKPDELVLFETEKDFLDKMHQNFKMVKKLTDWFTTVGKDSFTEIKPALKLVQPNAFTTHVADEPAKIALNSPNRNSNVRWIVKAEFAPVFNSQASLSPKVADALTNSSGAQNYRPQETSSENTFSGGMVAGYKVSKRFVVKSGIVYNSIRQTTRNVDLMGVNPLYNVPGNSTLAATPAGQVSLDKAENTSTKAFLNADSQVSMATKSTAPNELKQDIAFIEIPVQATYKLIDSKFNVGLTGGISTNILVGNKAVMSENGQKIGSGETSNMRGVVYSGAVGLEVGYELTNRITLTVEPRLKRFINSLSTSKSVDYKPSQLGIVTGLTYSFN